MKTIIGTWLHGLEINGTLHKEFELREATAGDLFDAEADASVSDVLSFNGALAIRQFVRVGTYTGPVVMEQIRKLKPKDLQILTKKQKELEALDVAGEAAGGGKATTATPSS